MKKSAIFFVVCVLLHVRSEPLDSQIVWLKDATTSLETDRRTHTDFGLPDELTFHLIRGSDALTLNLKRNYGIDPNANVYVVRKLNNGQSLLEKAQNLHNEDLAYYQDKENGAFMSVRCVRRSNGQCDRIINGNVRIGEINYDLRLAEGDITSRNWLDTADHLGTRYVLRDQSRLRRDISIEINKDAANANHRNAEEKLKDLLRRSPKELDKRNHFLPQNATLDKRDKIHNRKVYWVEVAVLIDSGIWDLFSSVVVRSDVFNKDALVQSKIREFFSHVFNGVNMLYNRIEDSGIHINVALHAFYIFKSVKEFPHSSSSVQMHNGNLFVEASKYLKDIGNWDNTTGSKEKYDHAMLFTRHDLFQLFYGFNEITGLSLPGKVCETGFRVSVVEAGDYFKTTTTAAHELGHNLGAVHDGQDQAKDCKSEDLFIMSSDNAEFDPKKPYSRNPWIFSTCSVKAFKETLSNKECVINEGVFFDKYEWMKYVKDMPGKIYRPDEQCQLINGPRSALCTAVSPAICRFMKCTDPKTDECLSKYFSAARGTTCGEKMWCMQGLCVPEA